MAEVKPAEGSAILRQQLAGHKSKTELQDLNKQKELVTTAIANKDLN